MGPALSPTSAQPPWSEAKGTRPTGLADAAGQVSLAQSFDPFGGAFESAGAGQSDFSYTGEWCDSYTELLYLRARYFDADTGRFVSKDPWEGDELRPQTLNEWSYVEDNPVRFVDPSGHQGCQAGDCALPPVIEGYVKDHASTFGVPWQIVAGVLKSEVELDTELRDTAEDVFWLSTMWPLSDLYLLWKPDPGPGIGNVHVKTVRRAGMAEGLPAVFVANVNTCS